MVYGEIKSHKGTPGAAHPHTNKKNMSETLHPTPLQHTCSTNQTRGNHNQKTRLEAIPPSHVSNSADEPPSGRAHEERREWSTTSFVPRTLVASARPGAAVEECFGEKRAVARGGCVLAMTLEGNVGARCLGGNWERRGGGCTKWGAGVGVVVYLFCASIDIVFVLG